MTDTALTNIIRAAGGIVHSDGNIFFKSVAQFQSAAQSPLVAFAKSIEADRAAFEAWADALPDCLPPAPKAAAWKAWQAAVLHEREMMPGKFPALNG